MKTIIYIALIAVALLLSVSSVEARSRRSLGRHAQEFRHKVLVGRLVHQSSLPSTTSTGTASKPKGVKKSKSCKKSSKSSKSKKPKKPSKSSKSKKPKKSGKSDKSAKDKKPVSPVVAGAPVLGGAFGRA
jgi:hypothetical protein